MGCCANSAWACNPDPAGAETELCDSEARSAPLPSQASKSSRAAGPSDIAGAIGAPLPPGACADDTSAGFAVFNTSLKDFLEDSAWPVAAFAEMESEFPCWTD
jgi:hypothetical protein